MLQLVCHPDTPAVTVETIEVATERLANGGLWIRFHLEGHLESLKLSVPSSRKRTDKLWQTTCFEAFVREAGGSNYLEYNFAPSGQWAAYSFTDYRSGMGDFPVSMSLEILLDASEGHFAMETEILLPDDLHARALELNLTAVIEETDGTKSYWALAHPQGKPDFHHKDCFALRLEAPSAA